MCFSATASFTATALLLPTGLYACKLALDCDRKYLPLALIPCMFSIQQGFEGVDTFSVTATQGSIVYQTQIIYDQFFPRAVSRLIYLLLIVVPLWLSPLIQLRVLGSFLALSLVVAYGFYNYAFVSVWCFFAAGLSAYIVYFLNSSLFKPKFEET